jgi:hypothetical protein|tara:strand:- start:308 stop:457 length:150 start_codon:yes stop_codon:yes gene_type:complete
MARKQENPVADVFKYGLAAGCGYLLGYYFGVFCLTVLLIVGILALAGSC